MLVRADPVPVAANPAANAQNAPPAPAWRSVAMWFDARSLVAKAVRQLDVIAGALDSFGHYGFYVTRTSEDGEERGYWLMENR